MDFSAVRGFRNEDIHIINPFGVLENRHVFSAQVAGKTKPRDPIPFSQFYPCDS